MGASTQNVTETPRPSSDSEITLLDWDSQHFGFPVARIRPSDSGEQALATVLARARRQGVVMVVWTTTPETHVPAGLLSDFQGALVDEKATFAGGLATISNAHEMAELGRHTFDGGDDYANEKGTLTVDPYADETASEELLALSIAAGVYSRFNCDPRFPRGKFEKLYHIWMERSVRRELADVVLVARDTTMPSSGSLGMITSSVADTVGSIGLIAVAEKARGQRVGLRLIHAAHDWMREHGAVGARVVTQGGNLPACRLYERAGYRRSSVEHYYHFWPQAQR